MAISCAFCTLGCSDRYPYRFGEVRGYLCTACSRGLDLRITWWAGDRIAEVARKAAAKEARELAKAEPRDVTLEAIPRGFRRAAG